MPRLSTHDVTEILEMLEDGINFVAKLSKVEKMKLRRKIREQAGWLQEWRNPSAGGILQKLEGKLSNVFLLYPHGFDDDFRRLLEKKTGRVRSSKV